MAPKPEKPDQAPRKRQPKSPPLPPTKRQKLDIVEKRKIKPAQQPQQDQGQDATEGNPTSTTATSSKQSTIRVDPCPPRTYGYWMHGPGDARLKPWALIIFSGRSREGDLQHALCELGWRVCAIDVVAPRPTDILCDATWDSIRDDILASKYSALWVATPCETFSPLREKQPGPRVLRTVEHIQGLPKEGLTMAEQKQVKESNILVSRTASATTAQSLAAKPWGIENPDHGEEKPSLWLMPNIAKVINEKATDDIRFDQCRTGLLTRKPTRLVVAGLDLGVLKELRCDHPPLQQTRPDGSTYQAAHPSTVQQWITNQEGKRERASKSQGEYTAELSGILARAFHATQAGAKWLREELETTPLP
eukprot:s625_g6.t1